MQPQVISICGYFMDFFVNLGPPCPSHSASCTCWTSSQGQLKVALVAEHHLLPVLYHPVSALHGLGEQGLGCHLPGRHVQLSESQPWMVQTEMFCRAGNTAFSWQAGRGSSN
jgi:hypothetical protein